MDRRSILKNAGIAGVLAAGAAGPVRLIAERNQNDGGERRPKSYRVEYTVDDILVDDSIRCRVAFVVIPVISFSILVLIRNDRISS